MMGGGYRDWGMLVGEVLCKGTMDTVRVAGFCICGIFTGRKARRWYCGGLLVTGICKYIVTRRMVQHSIPFVPYHIHPI